MMRDQDSAAVHIDGLELDSWQSYSFNSDLFSPCDAFSLQLGVGSSKSSQLRKNIDELRSKCKPGALTHFYINYRGKSTLQATGIADVREIGNDASQGTTFALEGRDLAALLVQSAAPIELYSVGDSLMKVARSAIAPWADFPYQLTVNADASSARDLRVGAVGVRSNKARLLQKRAESLGIPAVAFSKKVMEGLDNGTIDPDKLINGFAERTDESIGTIISAAQIYQLKVKEAAVQGGESVWEFLDRHAKRLGLLMRMGPEGTLIFQTIDYNQAPKYLLQRQLNGRGNNILSGGGRLDTTNVYSRVRVVGRSKAKDAVRSPFDVTVDDYTAEEFEIPYERTLLVHDNSIRSVSEAEKRAYRELGKTRQGAYVLTYMLRGHGTDGNVFAVDTIASVNDEVEGIKGDYYVVGRTFTRDPQNGARTMLKLVPKHAIRLEAA
jgi:prophage tail gpP-like protein